MEFNYAPVFSTPRMKQRLPASDLALNSPFNGRSSKPDHLLARSIKNVTYLYEPDGKNRESLPRTLFIRQVNSVSGFIFC